MDSRFVIGRSGIELHRSTAPATPPPPQGTTSGNAAQFLGNASDAVLGVRVRPFAIYCGAQALLICAFFLMPQSGWRASVQVGVGWAGAASVLVGAIVQRLPGTVVWCLLAAGLFFNASGIVVEHLLEAGGVAPPSPNLADAFYYGLYPCLIAGLGLLVYRHSANEDTEGLGITLGTGISTAVTAAMGVILWELIISPQAAVRDVGWWSRIAVTAYPLGDLVILALMLRLLLTGYLHNAAFGLMLVSILCFLGADIGWAVIHRNALPIGPLADRALESLSLTAYAAMGAAVLHPTIHNVARIAEGPSHARPAVWGSLAASLLTGPVVLLIEALFDRVYGPTFP
jgi:hypothetical protein